MHAGGPAPRRRPLTKLQHMTDAPLFGWPLAVVGMVSAAALPDPERVVIFLGALGLGLGAGVGAGYAAWLKRVGAARLEVYQQEDRVKKASTLAKLEKADEELEEMRRDVADTRGQIGHLRGDLESERDLNERLRNDLINYALTVLHERGHIQPQPPREDKEEGDGDGK